MRSLVEALVQRSSVKDRDAANSKGKHAVPATEMVQPYPQPNPLPPELPIPRPNPWPHPLPLPVPSPMPGPI